MPTSQPAARSSAKRAVGRLDRVMVTPELASGGLCVNSCADERRDLPLLEIIPGGRIFEAAGDLRQPDDRKDGQISACSAWSGTLAFVRACWRDGRVAEGGGLLNRCTVKSRTGGSNPPLSAIFYKGFVRQAHKPKSVPVLNWRE